jgi:hypothetical protein
VWAQLPQWNSYSTTVYREGPGFRLGDVALVFHPGIAVETGYDSNVFFSPNNETGAGLLRIRAHFDLATLPAQRSDQANLINPTAQPKVEFRFSTQIEYREFLSDIAAVRDLRSVNVFAAADLTILPAGPFTLRLNDTYIRAVDPRTQDSALPLASGASPNFSRNWNRIGFLATYRPGSGRLELGLGDFFQLNKWEEPFLQIGDQYVNEAQLFARWRFLPQTIGNVLVRVGYYNFPNNPQLEAVPVRATAGVSTLFTRWLGGAAQIGYGNSIHLRGPSFNSVLAEAELRFFLPANMRITLGYDRDFYDTLFADYYVDDKLFLDYEVPFVKRVTARVGGDVRFRDYEGLINPALINVAGFSSTNRKDIVASVRAEIAIRCTQWLEVAGNYNLAVDHTDFNFIGLTGTAVNASYLKHSVLVRADIAY